MSHKKALVFVINVWVFLKNLKLGWGSTVSRLQNHYKTVYFSPEGAEAH